MVERVIKLTATRVIFLWLFILIAIIGAAFFELTNIIALGKLPMPMLVDLVVLTGFVVLCCLVGIFLGVLKPWIYGLENIASKWKKLASIDPLTGIYNRRHLKESFDIEVAKAKRTGEFISLIMFDLDGFKRINDTYGHDVGDQVLVRTSKVTIELIRLSDIFSRIGGEEFVILMPNTTLAQSISVASKIQRALNKQSIVIKKQQVKWSASFGVVEIDLAQSFQSNLKHVDTMMYLSKQNGKNTITSPKNNLIK